MSVEDEEREKYRLMWGLPQYRQWSPGLEAVMHEHGHLQLTPGERVADFGGGSGAAALWLASQYDVWVTVVDFAPNARAVAHPRVRFIDQCLWNYVALDRYDVGVCFDVMEHVPPVYVDRVLSCIYLAVARGCLFQIATRPDQMGSLIGRPLHLTVEPAEWWERALRDNFGRVRRLPDAPEGSVRFWAEV